MAYFLKKHTNKKGTYLQIYESFYDPARKGTAQKSVKALGYVEELKAQGIKDPISYFRAQVDCMNNERRKQRDANKIKKIERETPERYVGHFVLEAIVKALNLERDFSYLQIMSEMHTPIFEILFDLVYARVVKPCSKRKTFDEVIPCLYGHENKTYSKDQLYSALEFFGSEYAKVIEVLNHHLDQKFGIDTTTTYFDCTNFYFEIDTEDDFRRKGPSKENRRDPIVGLGLLLGRDCIPLGMKLYPGNESEKPILKDVIQEMKQRSGSLGRTVRVADKGLNCVSNIVDAYKSGDGYIFSKSVRQLSKIEQAWALDEQGFEEVYDREGKIAYYKKSIIDTFDYKITKTGKSFALQEKRLVTYNPKLARKQRAEIDRQIEKARSLRASQAKRSEYGDSAKFVTFSAVDAHGEINEENRVVATLNHKAIDKARATAGYNMIVTSEIQMSDTEIYKTYHELWRIEESFRTMKSYLGARPVFLQKSDSITGHFLICYIAVLLVRILQLKILKDQFSTEQVIEFLRNYRIVQDSPRKYINISRKSDLILELSDLTGLLLDNYYLTSKELKEIMDWKLPSYFLKQKTIGAS